MHHDSKLRTATAATWAFQASRFPRAGLERKVTPRVPRTPRSPKAPRSARPDEDVRMPLGQSAVPVCGLRRPGEGAPGRARGGDGAQRRPSALSWGGRAGERKAATNLLNPS